MTFHPNCTYRLCDRLGNSVVIEFRHSRESSGWYIRAGWLGVIAGTRSTAVDIGLVKTCVADGDLRVERVGV